VPFASKGLKELAGMLMVKRTAVGIYSLVLKKANLFNVLDHREKPDCFGLFLFIELCSDTALFTNYSEKKRSLVKLVSVERFVNGRTVQSLRTEGLPTGPSLSGA
jgi:hypothetical protein